MVCRVVFKVVWIKGGALRLIALWGVSHGHPTCPVLCAIPNNDDILQMNAV